MVVSVAVELIWNLAAKEAAASEFKEIEPDHFAAAVLKFAEIPEDEVFKFTPSVDAAIQIKKEIQIINEELRGRQINSAEARRDLRSLRGKGGSPFNNGSLHRSNASKTIFDIAARMADMDRRNTLTADYLWKALLSSPSPFLTKVLGVTLSSKPIALVKLSQLEIQGRDLTKLAREGNLEPLSESVSLKVQVKVLIQLLIQAQRRMIFLVSDNATDAEKVAFKAASIIAGPDCPASLKGCRIYDLTKINPQLCGEEQFLLRMKEILREAFHKPEIWVLLPDLELNYPELGERWVTLLKESLKKGALSALCRVSPPAYARWAAKDPEWKRLAHPIWLHQDSLTEIPLEL
ncbi:MAG: hypothetical protein V2A61_05695 [Calditrichota bacterium]